MTEQKIDSAAFHKALLKSERRRIQGVIVFVVMFTATIILRILIYGSRMNPWGVIASVVLVLYEIAMLRIATYVAAICSPGQDHVELLSAGHAPIFSYSAAKKELSKFEAQALPLGIVPDFDSEAPVVLNLQQGDLVLLITDGFFEWENAREEQFGLERVADTVRKSSHLPPEEIIAELHQAVMAFAGGTKQKDDLTAVVIKRTQN